MPATNSYTYSFPGSATFSQSFPFGEDIFSSSGLDQMLAAIPDNTGNLIQAVDVRNAVFTLWKRTDLLNDKTISDFTYTSATPSTQALGGWPKGTNFSGQTLGELFEGLFHPYVLPSLTISFSTLSKFKGQSPNLSANWSLDRGSDDIVSFSINSLTVSVTGISQSGTSALAAIQWEDTTFTASVSDGLNTVTTSARFLWTEKVWWGTSEYFGVTYSSSQIQSLPSSSDKRELDLIFDDKSLPRLNGSGDYLVFAWPSYFGTPVFFVNGLVNNAFTKIHGSGSTFSQSVLYTSGSYTQSYDLWMSNTQQYSPIDHLKITT